MIVETTTFRLAPGTAEAEFVEADSRLQTDFFSIRDGFLRRTTARDSSGDWLVVTLWDSEKDAQSCAARAKDDPIHEAFMSLVDRQTVVVKRYVTLD